MGLKERFGVDLGVFKDSTTWKALGIGLVLFSIIGYAGLSMFDLASSGYGVDRDNIRLAPDFEVETVNRTVEDSPYVDEDGWFKLSDHRGKVVVVDFMAIDCANCHLVQAHLETQVDDWRDYGGDYEIIIVSVGMWYSVEDLDMLNDTFGDPDSDSHMPWIVATGQEDSVLKSDVILSNETINSSEVDLSDGSYCIEAQVNNSEKEVSCFDIGQGLEDNDDLNKDVVGIEIIIQDNSSGSFSIDTELEGNVSWEIVEFTRGDMVEEYQAQAIPVVLVIDHEGFIVAKENSGTPTGGWDEFDSVVLAAANGEAEDLRFSLAEVDRSAEAIFTMGLLLGVLVYFSPCAFPILPGYISYYIGLGQREDELIEAGKLDSRMPAHWILGGLAALGQLTFFAIIGVVVLGLGSIVNLSGVLHYFALAVAILLIVLGAFMLTGGTAHLLGFVQKLVDKYSTTEMDERFTPKRNMYLWGIGYSAASIDCTAAAVIPFIAYLAVIGGFAMWTGLTGLMLSVSFLMIGVTTVVGMGQQQFITILRRSTGLIKAIGAWMMMMAGIALTFYLTQPELIASWL
jgi:cytochrome c-type biogenesis protein